MTLNGVLLDTPDDHLRNVVQPVNPWGRVKFTTRRVFDTMDPLDKVLKYDEAISLSIASGDLGDDRPWPNRFEHG